MNRIAILIIFYICSLQLYSQNVIEANLSYEQCNTSYLSPCGNYFKQQYLRLDRYLVKIDTANFVNSYEKAYRMSTDASIQFLISTDSITTEVSKTKIEFDKQMIRRANRFLRKNNDLTKNLGYYKYHNYNIKMVVDSCPKLENIKILIGFENNKAVFATINSMVYNVVEIISVTPSTIEDRRIFLK